jgi:hypothetical protein
MWHLQSTWISIWEWIQTQRPSCVSSTKQTAHQQWAGYEKFNHNPVDTPINKNIARLHTFKIMEQNSCNYAQHLPGVLNVLADSVPRDCYMSGNQLVSMLTCLHEALSPCELRIVPLLQKYISKVAFLAQK